MSVAPAVSATCRTTEWSPTCASAGVPPRDAVPSPASVTDNHDGQVVHVIVQPSLESLSSSDVVMLYEYALSSVAAVTAVLEIEGASLVLATVRTKVSVTEAGVLSSSVAVTTIVCGPTSASTGVPDNTPAVLIVRVLGIPVAVKLSTSVVSASAKLPDISRL